MNTSDIVVNDSFLITKELTSAIETFLINSFSPKTAKAYKKDFEIFADWCLIFNLSPLPAHHETIAAFLADQAKNGIKVSTLNRRIAAIKAHHGAKGLDSPTSHPYVKVMLKGIKRTIGAAQNKKAPIIAGRLEKMVAFCDTSELRGLRDRAILLIGFAGAFRRSEIVALNFEDLERTPEGIKITIRKSKTDQEGLGQTIAIINGSIFRVVDALYDWLKAACITEGAIFTRIRKGDKMTKERLTAETIYNLVKNYASMAGLTLTDFSPHSLRSGFITQAAMSGANLIKTMEVSRHRDPKTVMGYIREANLFEDHAGEKFL